MKTSNSHGTRNGKHIVRTVIILSLFAMLFLGASCTPTGAKFRYEPPLGASCETTSTQVLATLDGSTSKTARLSLLVTNKTGQRPPVPVVVSHPQSNQTLVVSEVDIQ